MNVTPSDYGLPVEYQHHYSGKVRDIYLTPQGNYLFIASDRISAFDFILTPEIADKGKILTQISLWWFEQLGVKNHLVEESIPQSVQSRAMVGRALQMFEVECVVRGYLAGSGWKEYQKTGMVCGNSLPSGLKEFAKLPEDIFTPATKEALGQHDENIDFAQMESIVGKDTAEELRQLSLSIFKKASQILSPKGLILADTKFEFGQSNGEVYLADEVLTPDSSRFWVSDKVNVSEKSTGFDKQFVRDWILSTGWNAESGNPPPELPDEIVSKTRDLYIKAYEHITGEVWKS
jgi:phosphoribosylaminoimidazole-succinocarboxamide synthase